MKRLFMLFVVCFVPFALFAADKDASTVMLAGTGPTPGLQSVIDGVAEVLLSNGIKVKIVSSESKSRVAVLGDMEASGNTILLFVTLNQDPAGRIRPKIIVESFLGGKKIWEEEQKGGMVRKSQEKWIADMLKGISEKLQKHIGEPSLPSVVAVSSN